MDEEALIRIINRAPIENDHWDFKEKWHEDNGELLRDIINFTNTPHHDDCYIILGVDDKGADENLIPLCLNCANTYDIAPTIDDYKKLVKIKERALNTFKLDQNLQNTSLEQQIADVVKKISQLDDEDIKGNKTEMSPVTVKEKIPNSLMLQLKVTNMVQLFYNIINRQLAHLSESTGLDLDIVVQQFSIAYKKIRKYRNTREEQFQSMVTWLQQELNLSDSYKTACEFVIAFFVQNCEVFEKIETAK